MSSFNVSIKSVRWLKLFWTCCAFLHCSVDILCWGLWVVTGLWTVLLAPLAPGSPGSWLLASLAPGSPVSWLPWLLAPLAPGSPGSWQDYRSWYKTRRFMTFNRGNSSGWRIGYGPCSSLICRNGWCRTCFSLELYLLPHLTRHHHNSTQIYRF